MAPAGSNPHVRVLAPSGKPARTIGPGDSAAASAHWTAAAVRSDLGHPEEEQSHPAAFEDGRESYSGG